MKNIRYANNRQIYDPFLDGLMGTDEYKLSTNNFATSSVMKSNTKNTKPSNIFSDYLKSLNTKENSALIKNDKFYFNDYGNIKSKDTKDYSYDGKISNPTKLYDEYKKRQDVIDGIQKGLNTLKITDYENKPLKTDAVFGPKTQSAWNKFANEELSGQTNYLQEMVKINSAAKIVDPNPYHDTALGVKNNSASSIIKGMNPIASFIDPLQTNMTHVGSRKILTKSGLEKYQLYDVFSNQRLLEFDQHGLPNAKGTIIPDTPHMNIETSKGTSRIQKQISKSMNHKPIPKPIYETFKNFDDVAKVMKNSGKALTVAGFALDLYELGNTIYLDRNDEDGQLGKKTLQTSIGIGASYAGGASGAKLGAMGGAALGTFICPGLGTAIGGFLGGIGGGIVGALGSRALGEHIVDKTYKGD